MKESKLWLESVVFSFFILVLFLVYTISFYQKHDLYIWNKIFANTSVILISLSMGIRSFAYYIKGLNSFIIYRKYLGLIGFYFILIHGVIIFIMQNRYPFPVYFLQSETIVPFILALISTFIFVIVAVASHNYVRSKLNILTWRKIMRLGHIALVFGLLHFAVKSSILWTDWFKAFFPLYPPPSLIAFFVGLITIAFRISLNFDKTIIDNEVIENE